MTKKHTTHTKKSHSTLHKPAHTTGAKPTTTMTSAHHHRMWTLIVAGLIIGAFIGYGFGQALLGNTAGKSVAPPLLSGLRIDSFYLSNAYPNLNEVVDFTVVITHNNVLPLKDVTLQIDFGDGDVLGTQGNVGEIDPKFPKRLNTAHVYQQKGTYNVVVYLNGEPSATETVYVG